MEWWKEFVEISLGAEGESASLWVRPHAGKFQVGVRHRQTTIWETEVEAEALTTALSDGVARFEKYVATWKVICENPAVLKPMSAELAHGMALLAQLEKEDAVSEAVDEFDPVAAGVALGGLLKL